jgi:hypothetical protein
VDFEPLSLFEPEMLAPPPFRRRYALADLSRGSAWQTARREFQDEPAFESGGWA